MKRVVLEESPPRSTRRPRHQADPEAQAAYLEALPKYFTVTAACAKAGIAFTRLQQWREHDGAFLVKEQTARDAIADQLEAEAIRRAFKGIRVPVYQGGLLAGHITQYSDQLLTLMLKALRPEKFRERSEISVTQPIVKVVAGFDPAQAL
jgi:hypothetical protein